jgi:hypothetical protein
MIRNTHEVHHSHPDAVRYYRWFCEVGCTELSFGDYPGDCPHGARRSTVKHFVPNQSSTVFNLGLGRDSLAMLVLLCEKGWLPGDGVPMTLPEISAVQFSDVGAEWPFTYALIPRVRAYCEEHGLRFFVLQKPADEVWQADPEGKAWTGKALEPLMRAFPDESVEQLAQRGRFHRRLPIIPEYERYGKIAIRTNPSCTFNHKVLPNRRFIEALGMERWGRGVTNRVWSNRVAKGLVPKHRVILGIAADEARRAINTNRPLYERAVYPLVEMGVSKYDEQPILDRGGFGDALKSGCYMCPHQRIGQYFVLRERYPELWQRALKYEAAALEGNPKMFVSGKGRLPQMVNAWRKRHADEDIDIILARGYDRCTKVGSVASPADYEMSADDMEQARAFFANAFPAA